MDITRVNEAIAIESTVCITSNVHYVVNKLCKILSLLTYKRMYIYEQVNQQILPRKFAVMAHSHIRALSSEMPRKLTIVAQLIRDPAQCKKGNDNGIHIGISNV
jgi:hypothetical protein